MLKIVFNLFSFFMRMKIKSDINIIICRMEIQWISRYDPFEAITGCGTFEESTL